MACSIILREGFNGPFGGIGFFVGHHKGWYDLTKAKSFIIMAKGKGTLRISFETQILDTLSGNPSHFGYVITPSEQWTRIEIPLDSLSIPPHSPAFQQGYTWEKVAHQVQRVEFGVYGNLVTIGDTVEIWLDDMKLTDIQLEDLTY